MKNNPYYTEEDAAQSRRVFHTSGACGINEAHSLEDHDQRKYKVGDRVTFVDVTTERTGIVRGFQLQDWSDDVVAIIDIDPPLRGAAGRSMSRRVEQRHITGRAR